MGEYFIGKITVNKKGNVKGTIRVLKEGECLFEADSNSNNKIKCIFTNSDDLGKGEELIIAEKAAPVPKPRYEAFRSR